ncbi:hypothetical protein [Acinetobacter wuhouensis]|uniref:Uncharacterized protein n=1 Tax=Acinetobacter wuhouensis TaxID=1879050 RepID=A0A4Q7ALG9_9GAMM|nr:hypothetical protein [Acinetobacter wuhouensis]RZG44814.1 hypothetical protein EXU28_13565 [Acinetobacter wuhouensis]RZG72538.1 hypothetical protein EXU29_09965 [Acinetobacter wuhouensis]
MLNLKNKYLSYLHILVAVIVAMDTFYLIYLSISNGVQDAAYLTGGLVGKFCLIVIHYMCSREVQHGSTIGRIASIFFTLFVLAAFPIGTVIGIFMLFFSIFKWDQN